MSVRVGMGIVALSLVAGCNSTGSAALDPSGDYAFELRFPCVAGAFQERPDVAFVVPLVLSNRSSTDVPLARSAGEGGRLSVEVKQRVRDADWVAVPAALASGGDRLAAWAGEIRGAEDAPAMVVFSEVAGWSAAQVEDGFELDDTDAVYLLTLEVPEGDELADVELEVRFSTVAGGTSYELDAPFDHLQAVWLLPPGEGFGELCEGDLSPVEGRFESTPN